MNNLGPNQHYNPETTFGQINGNDIVDAITEYAIYVVDPDGNIITWNEGARLIKGYTRKDIIGKNFSLFYTRNDIDRKIPQKNLSLAIEYGNYSTEGWRVKKDGTIFWADINIKPFYKKKNTLCGFIKIVKEITIKKHEVDKFKGLLETAPDSMIICNADGIIELVNKQTEMLFGYKRAELVNQPLEILVSMDKKGSLEISKLKYLKNNKTKIMGAAAELEAVKKDGTKFPVEVLLSPLKLSSETFMSVAIRDVTERKDLINKLQENNKMLRMLAERIQTVREDERTAISREIHDELGQRLTAIRIDLNWLNKNYNQGNDQAKNRFADALFHLDETIQTVRKIAANLRPTILDNFGFIEALKWCSQDFSSRTGIQIQFESSISDFQLPDSYSTSLFRIFQECFTNIARHSEATQVNTKIVFEDMKIILTISDNGKGFDINTTEKKTFGLNGLKERVLLLNGDLQIKSAPDSGTNITVTVPLADEINNIQ